MDQVTKKGQVTIVRRSISSDKPSKIQQILEERRNQKDREYKSFVMIGVSLTRFLKTGFPEEAYQPLSFFVDLRKIHDPLLKRIATNLGSAPAPYYPHHIQTEPLIFEDRAGKTVVYEWDMLGDEESPEQYLERHYTQMDISKIILIPTEPNFMQATIAMKWAHKIGFPIPMPTVRKYIKDSGRVFSGIGHAHTNSFYKYLLTWGKRVS